MPAATLTRRQQTIAKEIRALLESLRLNPDSLVAVVDREYRTTALALARLHLIRGEVITTFTVVDDLLTHFLAIEMMGGRKQEPWRKKRQRFERVKSVLVESRMSLRHKLDLFRSFRRVPKQILEVAYGLNTARNALAHVFHLEGRKRRARYRGQDILSIGVFDRFQSDTNRLLDFLVGR